MHEEELASGSVSSTKDDIEEELDETEMSKLKELLEEAVSNNVVVDLFAPIYEMWIRYIYSCKMQGKFLRTGWRGEDIFTQVCTNLPATQSMRDSNQYTKNFYIAYMQKN